MTSDMTERRKELMEKTNELIRTLWATNLRRGEMKAMDCPLCGGKQTLFFSRNDYNGHLSAACYSCRVSIRE